MGVGGLYVGAWVWAGGWGGERAIGAGGVMPWCVQHRNLTRLDWVGRGWGSGQRGGFVGWWRPGCSLVGGGLWGMRNGVA